MGSFPAGVIELEAGDPYGTRTRAFAVRAEPGETILGWRQALDAALAWFELVENPTFVDAADLTVRAAIEEYAAMRDARDSARAGRPIRSDGRSRLTRYVVVDEQLSRINLHDLTEGDLKARQGRRRA